MCSSLLHQKLPNNGNQDIIEQEAIESVHWQKFEKKCDFTMLWEQWSERESWETARQMNHH